MCKMSIMSSWFQTESNSSARELQKGDNSYISWSKNTREIFRCWWKHNAAQWDEKRLYFPLSSFSPSLSSTHLFAFLHSKPQLGLVISTWCLILKNGFSKIKSLYIWRKRLSRSAAFTSICRQTTQTHNHNANQIHLFWRSNSNLSKKKKNLLLGAFTCHLIHVVIIWND